MIVDKIKFCFVLRVIEEQPVHVTNMGVCVQWNRNSFSGNYVVILLNPL